MAAALALVHQLLEPVFAKAELQGLHDWGPVALQDVLAVGQLR
jgi:hypothetical protein